MRRPHSDSDTSLDSTSRSSSSSLTCSLPSPFPLPPLSSSPRTLYLHHESIAIKLSGKDAAFRAASRRAASSAHAASDAATTLAQLRDAEMQLTEELRALRARRVRNRLFPKRANARQAKVQGGLEDAAEEAMEAKRLAAEAVRKALGDQKKARGLKEEADRLEEAQRGRRAILEREFEGVEAGSLEENEVERERNRLVEVVGTAEGEMEVQKRAFGLLRAATADLQKARRGLQSAQVSNTVDLFSGGGLGLVAGLGSQYKIQGAAKLARSAGVKIEEAVRLNEGLPISKLAKVQDGIMFTFVDVVLDGFVTDLIVRYTIEKAIKSVDSVLTSVVQSLAIQTSVVQGLESRFQSHTENLGRASEELVNVRAALILAQP